LYYFCVVDDSGNLIAAASGAPSAMPSLNSFGGTSSFDGRKDWHDIDSSSTHCAFGGAAGSRPTSAGVHPTEGHHDSYVARARGKGIFGTMAYMAPEVIGQFADSASRSLMEPYTGAVDWYSLGVLVHEFMVGKTPFKLPEGITYRRLVKIFPDILRENSFDLPAAFTSVFGSRMKLEGDAADNIGAAGLSLLDGLLELDASKRLGIGAVADSFDEFFALKSHSFFRSIDWKLLESKQLKPPLIPSISDVSQFSTNKVLTCDDILTQNKRLNWCGGSDTQTQSVPIANRSPVGKDKQPSLEVADDDQLYFQDWHFVHSVAIQKELIASYQLTEK